jgi:hypothetical protein
MYVRSVLLGRKRRPGSRSQVCRLFGSCADWELPAVAVARSLLAAVRCGMMRVRPDVDHKAGIRLVNIRMIERDWMMSIHSALLCFGSDGIE